jgi:MinD superfamily P-loop ATPase
MNMDELGSTLKRLQKAIDKTHYDANPSEFSECKLCHQVHNWRTMYHAYDGDGKEHSLCEACYQLAGQPEQLGDEQ